MSAAATAVTSRRTTHLARSLKILIPLIQEDLESGDRAGMEYYADAGAKLIEAKTQVTFGHWGRWLSKNFTLQQQTANLYMRLARLREEQRNDTGGINLPASLSEMRGNTARERKRKTREKPFRTALDEVAPDFYAQEKQRRVDEVKLHRAMALEMIDVGYKALASRLHPDRGGSKEAMSRLNVVRVELRGLAQTRRFV